MSSNGEKKRRSDNQGSNERSGKKVKSNHENGNNGDRDTEKMTKKVDPLEQNGLYAVEIAAHAACQHVLSCIVISKWIKYCTPIDELTTPGRQYDIYMVF